MNIEIKSKWNIEPSTPVGPQLYRILRERIICIDLEPGSRISESELAAEFAVSRQPVREAFIKLAEEGLLEVRPQRGTFVRKIAVRSVKDARFVREAIEADIVNLLAREADKTLVAELSRQIEQQKNVARKDWTQFIELDENFHRTLADAAGKTYAWNVVEGVKSQMDRVRHLSAAQFPIENLISQHIKIVNAIGLGDARAAEAAMREHLREVLKDLPAIANEKPEYFDDP